jgi:hypothetical protein
MADPDVDRFFEETVERSLRDYAEEGVQAPADPAAITQHATNRAASTVDPGPPRTSWPAMILGSVIAISLLLLLVVASGLVKLPSM